MAGHQRSPPGHWRLLAPAVGAWLCATIAVILPGTAAPIALVAASTGAILLIAAGSRRRSAMLGVLLILCAGVLLVSVRIATSEQARADPGMLSAADTGADVELEGRLTSFPESANSRFGERYWARGSLSTPSGAVPVLLWLDAAPPEGWGPGTPVSVRGRVSPQSSGDREAFAIEVAELSRHVEAESAPQALLTGAAARLRAGLHDAARAIAGAELVPGFAVGDTSLVPPELENGMLESSLSHLTAVSGANCALVTGAILALLGYLGVGRRSRIVVALIALGAFVGLVGPDASVRRAAVMAAVLLASRFGGKRGSALPALGLAIMSLLVMDPWESLQPGFALSVVSTAGILLVAAPMGDWLSRRIPLPRVLALPIAVACASQLACGPLLLLLQPGIPAIGVLANVLAAPAAPLGTGLGLLAALAVPLGLGITEAFVVLASIPAAWVAGIAEIAADLPAARWHWPQGWPGALTLAACQFAVLLAWGLRRGRLSLPDSTRRRPGRTEAPLAAEPTDST